MILLHDRDRTWALAIHHRPAPVDDAIRSNACLKTGRILGLDVITSYGRLVVRIRRDHQVGIGPYRCRGSRWSGRGGRLGRLAAGDPFDGLLVGRRWFHNDGRGRRGWSDVLVGLISSALRGQDRRRRVKDVRARRRRVRTARSDGFLRVDNFSYQRRNEICWNDVRLTNCMPSKK